MLQEHYRLNHVAGLSLFINSDGVLKISLCEIVAKGKTVNFENKLVDLVSVEEVKKHLKAGIPVSLNISGKIVLQKQTKIHGGGSKAPLTDLLPGLNTSDFYIQEFSSAETDFFSLIRKAEADKYIRQLKGMGLQVLMLSLGPFIVHQIVPQLNIYDGNLLFAGYEVDRNAKGDWLGIKEGALIRSLCELKIDSEPISEHLLIPYASAFQLLLVESLESIAIKSPELDSALADSLFKRKLQVKGFIVLVFCFALLLANFTIYSSLEADNNVLVAHLSSSSNANRNLESLNEQVKLKEKVLQSLGWDGGMNKSAIIDKMAALLPREVYWTDITVNPDNVDQSRQQKKLIIFNRRITVSGHSDLIVPVNEWVARLKVLTVIKSVQLESYSLDEESGTGFFTIIVDY